MYFTVINNVSNNQSSVQNNQMGGMISQGEPPEKPNDDSESSKSGTDSNVPDKPSNE